MGGSQGQQSDDLSKKKARKGVRSQCLRREATLYCSHSSPRGLEARTANVWTPTYSDNKGGPVKKKYSEFPDGDSRALNQEQAPLSSRPRATTQVTLSENHLILICEHMQMAKVGLNELEEEVMFLEHSA